MADSDLGRPGSRGYHASPVPPSPRPSVASRASKSSLRRETERQEGSSHHRPGSISHSRPHTPQTTAAPAEEQTQLSSPSPLQPAQPPFSPLFTLITSAAQSSNRQTVHHPTVHYVFADDDPETLTAALAHHHRGAYDDGEEEEGSSSNPVDRAILLDMEPAADGSGLEVAWASSLTPDWAVTSARVSQMEGGGGGWATSDPSGNNMILKIEGVSIELGSGPLGKAPTPDDELHSSGASAGRQQPPPLPVTDEYGELLQDFEKRMLTLRKVVEAGAARQRALGDQHGQFLENTAMEKAAGPFQPEAGGDGT